MTGCDSDQVPKAAIELAKRFEGFERKVKRGIEISAVLYICPAGFWTIGYGHLCDSKRPPITEAEAEVYLAHDLQTTLKATLRYCSVLATEPEGRLAAIVDFTFNLGAGRLQASTLRQRIIQRDWIAPGQERRWVYGAGRVLPGLVSRGPGGKRKWLCCTSDTSVTSTHSQRQPPETMLRSP